MNKKRYILYISVIILTYVIYKQKHMTTYIGSNEHKFQAEYMNNITIVDYNEAGFLKQKFYAKKWVFLPEKQKSNILQPILTVYKKNGDIWQLSSNNAEAWSSIDDRIYKVDMYHNVIIQRIDNNGCIPKIITSENIKYFPKGDKIFSTVQVKLKQPDLQINGIGMLSCLNNNWVKFLNTTCTSYLHNFIRAKQAIFDNTSNRIIYTTNVTIDNKDINLTANIIKIKRDKFGKINTFIAHGNPAVYNKKNGAEIFGKILKYNLVSKILYAKQSPLILSSK